MNDETLERHNYCEEHDEDFESTSLTSGEYAFCTSCSNEKIEANMTALRVELADKGYLGYVEYRSSEVA